MTSLGVNGYVCVTFVTVRVTFVTCLAREAFTPQLARGDFSHKNIMFTLLFSATLLFLVYSKHLVQTVLKGVPRNLKVDKHNSAPLMFVYS